MKLRKAQREALLAWIAEGLESDEINKHARKFKPPFKITRQQVDYYRKSRGVKIDDLKDAGEQNALNSGLAIKETRVAKLQAVADQLYADLMERDKLWLLQVKGIGGNENYERIEYYEFNASEVAQFRGLLDDIASELGDRTPGVQVNNTFNFDLEKWKQDRSKRLNTVAKLPAE